MRAPQNIIKRPLMTEKSQRLRETGGAATAAAEGEAYKQKLVFEVARDANKIEIRSAIQSLFKVCLLYTSPSPRDGLLSRMPSSA